MPLPNYIESGFRIGHGDQPRRLGNGFFSRRNLLARAGENDYRPGQWRYSIFGNPYRPEVYWGFKNAIKGMGEACRYFDTPVTGGNVSFYNESPNNAVYPTPVIGMLGLIEDLNHITTSNFKHANDLVYLLGEDFEEVGGSEYLKVTNDLVVGDSPKIDLKVEKALHETLLEVIRKGLINSAHDISEGGIITSLAESCIGDVENPIGVEVNIPVKSRLDYSLFSESQSRVIVSVSPNNQDIFEAELKNHTTPFTVLGKTTESGFSINGKISVSLDSLIDIYYNTISKKMELEKS